MLAVEPFTAFYNGARSLLRRVFPKGWELVGRDAHREFARMRQANGYPMMEIEVSRPGREIVPCTLRIENGSLCADMPDLLLQSDAEELLTTFDTLYDRHWDRVDLYHVLVTPAQADSPLLSRPALAVSLMGHARDKPRQGQIFLAMDFRTLRGAPIIYHDHREGFDPVRKVRLTRVAVQRPDGSFGHLVLSNLGYLLRGKNAHSWRNQSTDPVPWRNGQSVMVDYEDGLGFHWRAEIVSVRSNGRLDIVYAADGTREANVAARRVQPIEESGEQYHDPYTN